MTKGRRPYVDVHAHIGESIHRVPAVGQSIGRYIGRMADSAVYAAILSPTPGGPQSRGIIDTHDQNRTIAWACRTNSERFPVGLAIVEVRHLHDGVRELERAMDEDGLRGFMVHPIVSGHSLECEMYPFFEVAALRRGLCLLHKSSIRNSIANIASHAKRFPEITFILGHASMSKAAHDHVIAECGPCENTLFDIAQMPIVTDAAWDLAHMVRNLGDRRIMFGSDAPYYDYRRVQQLVESSDITDDAKDRIAYRNAEELIRRFRPDWRIPRTPIQTLQSYTEKELWATQAPGSPRLR